MAAVTVSCPIDTLTQLREKMLSPTKVFQFGAALILQGNNPDDLKNSAEKIKKLEESLELKNLHNRDLIERFARLEGELAIYRERFKDKPKTIEQEKKEIDKLLRDKNVEISRSDM